MPTIKLIDMVKQYDCVLGGLAVMWLVADRHDWLWPYTKILYVYGVKPRLKGLHWWILK